MISVIVPVYKVEKYLDRCVQSIFGQTLTDFELILVDDGSPDNSGKMCDNWAEKDKRTRVIHKRNGGLSSARNAGLSIAQGEYVTFVDSDDVIHPKYLETLFKLCDCTGVDISMGRMVRFSTEIPKSEECKKPVQYVRTGTEVLFRFFEKEVEVSNYVTACCKLYRRCLFEQIRFPEGRLFEDEFTTYLLFSRAEAVAEINTPLYYYFFNPSSITNNLTVEKRCDEYDAQWERLFFFKKNGMDELYRLAIRQFLSSGQWDYIESCKAPPSERLDAFQKQYKAVIKMMKKIKCMPFLEAYDYYVIAFPQRRVYYRVKRQLLLRINRI